MKNSPAIFLITLFSILLASCAQKQKYLAIERTFQPCHTDAACVSSIQHAIMKNWSRPASARNHMVVVIEFSLNDKFEIESSHIFESSGNTEYDLSALEAARRASPFIELAGLSDELKSNFSTVRLVFDPIDLRH